MSGGDRHRLVEDEDGEDRTRIDLIFRPDGGLRIDGVYAGPLAERIFGDCDHEFWMDVAPDHARALLAALARAAFAQEGRLDWTALRALCKAEGIPFEEGHWT